MNQKRPKLTKNIMGKIEKINSWDDYILKIILIYLSKEKFASFRELEAFFIRYLLDERKLYNKVEQLENLGLVHIYSGENYENGTTLIRCLLPGIEIGEFYEGDEIKNGYQNLKQFLLDTLNKRLEHLGYPVSLTSNELTNLADNIQLVI